MKELTPRRTTLRTLALAALAACTLGCRQLPKELGGDVQVLTSAGLEELNPNDVVVAPVINMMEDAGIPAETIRAAFHKALPRRRYSPLALEFVDSRVVDAAYRPGLLREDAVFEIVVHHWDESLWAARKALSLDLEARMRDPAQDDAPVVWSGRLAGRFEFQREGRFASDAAHLRFACDEIARNLLAAMPQRQTRPGRE